MLSNKLDYALIQNAAGQFPVPSIKSISAAAATVTSVPANNQLSIVDPPASAPGAYPISTFTNAIVPTSSPKASTLTAVPHLGHHAGQQYGAKLEFAPLPAVVVTADKATIAKIK